MLATLQPLDSYHERHRNLDITAADISVSAVMSQSRNSADLSFDLEGFYREAIFCKNNDACDTTFLSPASARLNLYSQPLALPPFQPSKDTELESYQKETIKRRSSIEYSGDRDTTISVTDNNANAYSDNDDTVTVMDPPLICEQDSNLSIQIESGLAAALTSFTFIAELAAFDQKISGIIQKWDFGIFEFILVIPGVAFSVVTIPLFCVWYWYTFGNPYLSILGVFGCLCATESLKFIFKRARPTVDLTAHRYFPLRKFHKPNNSFPSGDTAQSCIVATTLACNGYSPLWILLIPLTSFARVYFGCHWVADVCFGTIVGLTVALLANAFFPY